jgi:WD40 repeat protein
MPPTRVHPRSSVHVSGPGGGAVSALGAGNAGFVFSACAASSKMSLHELNEPAEIVSLAAPDERPASVAVAADVVKVAFGTGSGAVYVWDVLYPTAMESFRAKDDTLGSSDKSTAPGPAVTALAWHPRGHVLAAASASGALHVWDMVVGALIVPAPDAHAGSITGLAWTGNGRILLSAGHDGALRAWSPRNLELVGSITRDDQNKSDREEEKLEHAYPDGDDGKSEPRSSPSVMENSGNTPHAAARAAASGQLPEGDVKTPISTVGWHVSELTCLDAMADMSRVAITGGRDGAVLLSVLKPEQACGVFHAMPSHKAPVTVVKLADLDCTRPMRAASAADDGIVHLFDMDHKLPMGKFAHPGGSVVKLDFNRSADVLFSAAGSTVRAWDARASPEEEPPICFSGTDAKISDFVIYNNGATMACACDDGHIRLFDMRYPTGDAPTFDPSLNDLNENELANGERKVCQT